MQIMDLRTTDLTVESPEISLNILISLYHVSLCFLRLLYEPFSSFTGITKPLLLIAPPENICQGEISKRLVLQEEYFTIVSFFSHYAKHCTMRLTPE